jgi:predicted outer membrane repeat protein
MGDIHRWAMTALSIFRSLLWRLALVIFLAGSLAFYPWDAFAADGVVGMGSAASCTEAAFDAAFNSVESSGGGAITFSCGAAPHTIVFTAQKFVSADTELRGGGLITLSGGNAISLFQVYSGKTFTLSDITLARGYGQYGAVQNFGVMKVDGSRLLNNTSTASGGAIDNYGELHLTNALVANNSAAQYGGGVNLVSGDITITNTQFMTNTATSGGGGIAVGTGVTLTVSSSLFSGNQATDTFAQGGGIRSAGTLVISDTLLSQNHASRAGGIFVASGITTISRSTFSFNYGAYGGGIRQEGGALNLTNVTFTRNGYTRSGTQVNTGGGAISWGAGSATLTNVTMSNNWATYGGGFDHEDGTTSLTNVTLSGNASLGGGALDQGGGSIALTNGTIAGNQGQFFAGGIANRGGTITLKNTLLANNFNPQNSQALNCYKPIATSSFSLSSDFTCGLGTSRDNVDPLLNPLAYNGGFTQTYLPMLDSPAIDGGTDVGCPPTDQRGVTRPQGQACDVGAVEVTPTDLLVKLYLSLIR